MLFRRRLSGKEPQPESQPAAEEEPEAVLLDELGLHHLWYLELRLRDELTRSARTDRFFSLASWQVKLLPGELLDMEFRRRCAQEIKRALRTSDMAAQIGPGQFVAILFDAEYDDACTVAFRLKGDLGIKVPSAGRWQAGVSTFPYDGKDGNELIQVAFQRLDADAKAG